MLEDNARHPLALHVKADALYHLGNFEHALVFYQRGLRYSTQDPEIFRLGIRRATKAGSLPASKELAEMAIDNPQLLQPRLLTVF